MDVVNCSMTGLMCSIVSTGVGFSLCYWFDSCHFYNLLYFSQLGTRSPNVSVIIKVAYFSFLLEDDSAMEHTEVLSACNKTYLSSVALKPSLTMRTFVKYTQSPEPVFVLAASSPIIWPGTNEGRALQPGGRPLQHRSALFLRGKQEEEVR